MKLLLNFWIVALLLATCFSSEGKTITDVRECLAPHSGEGRINCQSRVDSRMGKVSLCFPCPPKPTQYDLNDLCYTHQKDHCSTGRCASNFLTSCKRSCALAAQCIRECGGTKECKENCQKSKGCRWDNCDNEQACNTSCEEYHDKNCLSCTAILMPDGC